MVKMKSPYFSSAITSYSDPSHEWVLLVPPRLTKTSYKILLECQCVARSWHLQGRHGSRTHKHMEGGRIGLPILGKDWVLEKAEIYPELKLLLETENIEVVYKDFTASNRAVARDIPVLDARIHSERAPKHKESEGKSKLPSSPPRQFTYVDLFAGIGGFAVALDALGGKCVMASEIGATCQSTYRTNFPEAPLYGDIYKIHSEQLPKQPVDLLVGGFPCQPFSALGEQPGLQCPKGRGHLFLEIVRLLKLLKPLAFILENVPGLLDMAATFEVILQALKEEAGYSVSYEVLNARGLTATSRKRLFIVGFLLNNDQNGSKSVSSDFEFPYIPDLSLRTHDVVCYDNSELTPMEQTVLPITKEQLAILNAGKKWRAAHLAWPNTVCSTLVSHYGNSITRGHSQLVPMDATCNEGYPRRFSPRECLRMMGFPASYRLAPKRIDIQGDMAYIKENYRMIGNAVCPPLVASLAGAVLGQLSSRKDAGESDGDNEWVDFGRRIAVDLARQATRHGKL